MYNGFFNDEHTAAHASDTLARKLMVNGEETHRLNFPDDSTEVYPAKKTASSKYFGVSYLETSKRWIAQRWSKTEKKIFNATCKDEETAARASDALAKRLTENGEHGHKLNFPDDTGFSPEERQTNRRKRSFDFGYS